MSIAAGRLTNKFLIQSCDLVQNELNEDVLPTSDDGWQTIGTWSAELKPIRAFDKVTDNQLRSETTHVLTGRYTKLITGKCRLALPVAGQPKPRLFHIVGEPIDPFNRHLTLELSAVERQK